VNSAREDRLERLFEAAAALPPARRDAFIARACGADAELRVTLEGLVAHAAAARDFVDRVAAPAVASAADAMLGEPAPRAGSGVAGDGSDALAGRRVAHFQLLERLGGGGMGHVYRAQDLRLDRVVALKFLPPHLSTEADARQRLVREAKAASALDHPSICAVHEIGETDEGQLFIAMAHCEGETLRQRIARGPLPVAEALELAAQAAEGLQRAHETGIVHRDVKPANLMVTRLGRVRIVDFGVAKIDGVDVTREGAAVGTVAYMSPEQTRGGVVDARADVWALGAVLYEMLTGARPFRGESDATVIHAIRHDAPTPVRRLRAEVPSRVATVVARCLEKDPARRYRHAGELLADVRTVQAGGTVRRRIPADRAARYAGAAALAVALLAAGALLTRPPPLDSLAVLPAATAAGDSAQAAFAEGMTGLLTDHLSQLSGLRRVVSRASVARYRNTTKSPPEVGRELGVDVLVGLSARREGGRARIDVELIAADGGRVLWSGGFERPVREVLTLQREVTQAIAHALQLRLTPREAARLAAAPREVHPEAFALYLQAARAGAEPQGMRFLERAIERDSAFALAHARVAVSYIMITRDRARAERAIATALALDPSLSDAYDALGLLRMWIDHDWPAAEGALRRAIELNPHNSVAHHELGQLLMRLGRCDEAVVEERRAVLQNPGIAHFQSGLAEVHLHCRRYDDAVREFGKTLALVRDSSGVYVNMGDAHFYGGRYEEALAMYARSSRPTPGWAYVPLGERRPAREQVDSLTAVLARREGNPFTPVMLARLHTTLGEREQALAWLERLYEQGSWVIVYLRVHPHFDPLRGEPRFQALLRKARLDG